MALSKETIERNKKLGERIAHQRKTLGMTQRELAQHLGLPYYTFISQVETGQATLPPSLWRQIAIVLLMDPLDFAVECLHTNYPEIYEQLFGRMRPSRVVALLSSVKTPKGTGNQDEKGDTGQRGVSPVPREDEDKSRLLQYPKRLPKAIRDRGMEG